MDFDRELDEYIKNKPEPFNREESKKIIKEITETSLMTDIL